MNSPVTNLPLANFELIPNLSFRSAINEAIEEQRRKRHAQAFESCGFVDGAARAQGRLWGSQAGMIAGAGERRDRQPDRRVPSETRLPRSCSPEY